jgi:hypothetical protein
MDRARPHRPGNLTPFHAYRRRTVTSPVGNLSSVVSIVGTRKVFPTPRIDGVSTGRERIVRMLTASC